MIKKKWEMRGLYTHTHTHFKTPEPFEACLILKENWKFYLQLVHNITSTQSFIDQQMPCIISISNRFVPHDGWPLTRACILKYQKCLAKNIYFELYKLMTK